ncbi:MAG: phage holin family protein [Peptococcaceae bacterium]|jgi:putative membrane protein|nr:phage holin family protein [Peptococcaceae bacterium]
MLGAIVRFIVSAIVLLVVSYLVPGLQIAGFAGALIAALVIAGLGWVIELAFGKNKVTRMHRGIIGFVTSAVIIYISQFIVPSAIHVSILGALLASLVIGIVDSIVPTELK